MDNNIRHAYWRESLKYILILLSLWFVVGLCLPVLLFEALNAFSLGGFPLGFWFGMQGSQISLTILLFVYAFLMNRLDKKYGLED